MKALPTNGKYTLVRHFHKGARLWVRKKAFENQNKARKAYE